MNELKSSDLRSTTYHSWYTGDAWDKALKLLKSKWERILGRSSGGRALQNDASSLDHGLDMNGWAFFELVDELLDWDLRVILSCYRERLFRARANIFAKSDEHDRQNQH